MEVESMIANTPSGGALVLNVGDLTSLAVDARLHDVILADGTVINVDVPGPECYGIPFLNLESFLGA
jgi:hypothetical protein